MRGWSHDEARSARIPPEVRDRAVRMVLEHRGEHVSQWAAIRSIAEKIGCTARDAASLGAAGRALTRACGLVQRRASASASRRSSARTASCGKRTRSCARLGLFCPGGARPPVQAMIAFIDEHRAGTGSSRSAACCRSPRRRITPTPPGAPIRRKLPARAQRDISPDGRDPARVRGELPASMASGRSGGSFSAKGPRSLAAPSRA